MDTLKYPQSLFAKIAWVTVLFLLVAGLFVQWLPVSPARRGFVDLLLMFLGLITLLEFRYVFPHYSALHWVISGALVLDILLLAVLEYLLESIEFAPIYMIFVVMTAIATRRSMALVAALIAGGVQILVTLSRPADLQAAFSQVAVQSGVYVLAAFLVSEVSSALTRRWKFQAEETARQRAEISQSRDELASLYEVSKAFANLEDAQETFRQITDRIAQLLRVEICMLARTDDGGRTVRGMPPGYGLSDEEVECVIHDYGPPILAHWDFANEEVFVANDIATLSLAMPRASAPGKVRGIAAARMMRGDSPIGIIYVANKMDGVPFQDKDVQLLSLMAGQAAVAVDNARLYAIAQQNLQNFTRLYAISAQLVARSDPDTIPTNIVHAVAEALNAPIGTIALVDDSTGRLEYAATLGVPPDAPKMGFRENGIAMTVLRTGEPRFIEDLQLADDINPVTRIWGFRATACLPIQHGDKRLGVLYVNYSEPHAFTTVEKNMLGIFAHQAAIALENARLHRAEQRKALELQTIANLSHSLAGTMDMEQIFRAIERQVREALPVADAGALFIYDAPADILIPRASFGVNPQLIEGFALHPGESIPGQVFLRDRAMLFRGEESIRELRKNLRPQNRAMLAAAMSRETLPHCVLCAPVTAGGEKLGVMVLESQRGPRAFSADDLRLLEALAGRAALAIRNAQLYARGLRRATQLAAVAHVARRAAGILDLGELLPTVAQLIYDEFGYRYVHLFINEPQTKTTIFRAGAGPAAQAMGDEGVTVRFGFGMVGWVAESGEPLLSNDVKREPHFVDHWLLPETRSELSIPLRAGARLLGVLDVQSERINAFEESDIAGLEALAGQIAIAIENAQLYGKVQDQARRDSLTQVYNHGYFLERLTAEIERARAEGCRVSLIMLDIDFFKEYNDRYGHVIGDQVLGAIVEAISAHVHKSDLVGRWGGEEFCIALLDADRDEALGVANRVRETIAVARLFTKAQAPILPPTVSQGFATFPTHATDAAELIDLADAALYRAKSRGRDQICSSDES